MYKEFGFWDNQDRVLLVYPYYDTNIFNDTKVPNKDTDSIMFHVKDMTDTFRVMFHTISSIYYDLSEFYIFLDRHKKMILLSPFFLQKEIPIQELCYARLLVTNVIYFLLILF